MGGASYVWRAKRNRIERRSWCVARLPTGPPPRADSYDTAISKNKLAEHDSYHPKKKEEYGKKKRQDMKSVGFPPWFRLFICTYDAPPWGVCVDKQTKSN